MSPQPVSQTMLGGIRPTSNPVRKMSGELDMDRKQELIMEKKLRACRVSILPKNMGYLEPPTPKKPTMPSISPEAVKKATNPIALRYWNQCNNMDTVSQDTVKVDTVSTEFSVNDPPPWVTSNITPPDKNTDQRPALPAKSVKVPDITIRMATERSRAGGQAVRCRTRVQSVDRFHIPNPHDDPSPMQSPRPSSRTEVTKVLSTAGTGIRRDNEKKEALGNINRVITMAMTKKNDAPEVRSAQKINTTDPIIKPNSSYEESKAYKQIKEEQIEKNQQRSNFLGSSEQIRIPKSPRPFRESRHRYEEPQAQPLSQQQQQSQPICSCAKVQTQFRATEIPFNTISDLVPKLNQQQTNHLGLSLFSQMSQDTVMEVVAQQLSVISGVQMSKVFSGLQNEAVNNVLLLLFGKSSPDVRLSLIRESLTGLSVAQKLDLFLESDEQIPVLIHDLIERMGYKERVMLVGSLLDQEHKLDTQKNHNGTKQHVVKIIPEIRLESSDEQGGRSSEEEEDGEWFQMDEGAISN